jgi:hypothetical protein
MDEMVIEPLHPPKPARPARPDAVGKPEAIREPFRKAVLGFIAERMEPAQALEVELWVAADGRVVFAELYRGGETRKGSPLTDKQRREAVALIKQLGSGRSKERTAAAAALKAMGRGVSPLLRKTAAATDDPEVQFQCNAIADALDKVLKLEKRHEIINKIKTLRYTEKDQVNRRFNLNFTREEIRSAKPNDFDGHIFEMAPAPLD